MVLYDLDLSGNCYKVRLMAALTDRTMEIRPVDFLQGEHKSDAFMARNPFGEIPVLLDGETTLRNSQAMLIYLARKAGRLDLYPDDPAAEAEVAQWLMVAENEIARGPNDARLHDQFGDDLDVEPARKASRRVLEIMNDHLQARDWLACGHFTIADIACFPYVALAEEGGVSLEPYQAVRSWIDRIRAIPGFIAMPGIEGAES